MKRPILALALLLLPCFAATAADPHRTIVIVVDGLRPDYLTTELMPNLVALGETGVVAEAHHAVFPTVTRVNSPSIATGTYPGTHGLMHNSIWLPDASPNPIDTADAEALLRADEATGGRLLTAPSIGELMTAAGKKVLVVGSGSTGASLLLNHRTFPQHGLLNSREFVRPALLQARAASVVGPFPALAYPNAAANQWAIDACLKLGLSEIKPELTFIWLTDPDGTAHRHGPGAPQTNEALRLVDREIGRLVQSLAERGLRDDTNIIVTADHGFSTHGGPFNLTALLTARGLNQGLRIVGGQIYVQQGGDEKIRQIVGVLQATDWVGAIFTRAASPGSREGFVTGTLSFDSIHYGHARAADILVDPNWSDAVNAHGYAGTTTSGGVAGHGTSSPFDIRIRLIASGPDFKRGLRSQAPTGNIDIAPTLCRLFGLPIPPTMSGRVLEELLRDGPSPESIRATKIVHQATASTPSGRYEVQIEKTRIGTTEYVDFTRTQRN